MRLIENGMAYPVRSMTDTAFERAAPAVILLCAQAFTGADGIKQSDGANVALYGECATILRKYYALLGLEEVKEAFRLAASGKILDSEGKRINLTAYGGRFTVNMFGEVLQQYQEWRAKIQSAILRERENAVEAERTAERHARFVRQTESVADCFERLRWTNDEIERWEDVPGWWAKSLNDKKLLTVGETRKKALWLQSKAETVAEAKRDLLAGRSTVLPDMRILRRAVNAYDADPETFPAELTDRAKIVYGKLLVWECLAKYQKP